MAHFVARGFIRFDAVVPDAINQQFLDDIGDVADRSESPMTQYGKIMQSSVVPLVPAGTKLNQAYPKDSALNKLVRLPEIKGAIDSLVGTGSLVDHHFLHITFPPKHYPKGYEQVAQPYHQDSTIDPRQAFDVQLFYFPHEVTLDMGGTRFVPGTHLRVVSEAAIARYQNIQGQQHVVCPAGTVMFFHMGLWHGGGLNLSEQLRYMFKIRLCPTKRQSRLWNFSDREQQRPQRPIFWTGGPRDETNLHAILTKPEKWFEADTGRLEYLNRIKLWRYITNDKNFDADYWLTRVENEYR